MGAILARATLPATLSQVRHVAPVHPRDARGSVAEVYRQLGRDFGMLAPPMLLHSPSPDALCASWLILRETLLATGHASRAVKEAVAAAVSRANTCPYCVDVHATTLGGLVRGRYATAVAVGRPASVGDPGLRAVAVWAAGSGTRAGAGRHRLPVPAGPAAELIGVAVVFHYLNRMVNLFLGSSPYPARLPAGARAGLQRLVGAAMAGSARRVRTPGAALDLLPAATPPVDLGWAAGSPRLAMAFGRAVAAVEAAGARSVPPAVRELVLARLAGWDGEPMGTSGAWVDREVAGLDPAERAAARLALLAAFASYRAEPSVIDLLRCEGRDDRALIELASWACLTAARRVGGWLWNGHGTAHRGE